MKKDEFMRELAKRANIKIKVSSVVVDEALNLLVETLERGEPVDFRGYVTFDIEEKPSYEYKHPGTLETRIAPARKKVKIKTGTRLKELEIQ